MKCTKRCAAGLTLATVFAVSCVTCLPAPAPVSPVRRTGLPLPLMPPFLGQMPKTLPQVPSFHPAAILAPKVAEKRTLDPQTLIEEGLPVSFSPRRLFDFLTDPSLIITILHSLEVAYWNLPGGFLLMPVINFFRVPNKRRRRSIGGHFEHVHAPNGLKLKAFQDTLARALSSHRATL
ncbi:hypothetical protein HDE_00828 [Halotydeus destructor]|nr:hypothetical protein HDE_00828 [Halotydeus destructor]